MWRVFLGLGAAFGLLFAALSPVSSLSAQGKKDEGTTSFAVIGDFGSALQNKKGKAAEKAVAKMVNQWDPDFIITLGDNNYTKGEASTIEGNIGKYYCDYIYNDGAPKSQRCNGWATRHQTNLFFPSLGNHDWEQPNAQPYIDYFSQLPGEKRYYDFAQGPVHFFAIDSQSPEACECNDPEYYEPDGTDPESLQGQWLKKKLKESQAPWKLVYFHHAPYTCKGASAWMRWPFKDWGASAVLTGHKHLYERITRNDSPDFPYFVNGVGGTKLTACKARNVAARLPASDFDQITISGYHGAMWVAATTDQITFKFYDVNEEVEKDHCALTKTNDGQKLKCTGSSDQKPISEDEEQGEEP